MHDEEVKVEQIMHFAMPKSELLRKEIQRHQSMRKTGWVGIPENFTVDIGQFDYDISHLDIDEKVPIARPNLQFRSSNIEMQHPAVYKGVKKFAVCKPYSSNKYR